MNAASDYIAFDVSMDRDMYAYGYRNMVRFYKYQSTAAAGKFAEAVLPDSWMVIVDIRFSPSPATDPGSVYVTVKHLDMVYRCDLRCPDGIFVVIDYEVICQNPYESSSIVCAAWSTQVIMEAELASINYFSPAPLPGYFVQGGCQVFKPQNSFLICVTGSFRPWDSQEEAARAWVSNTGMSGGGKSILRTWTPLEMGQLIGPPAYNRFTRDLYIFTYTQNITTPFRVFKIFLTQDGSISSAPELMYTHVDTSRKVSGRIVGSSVRVDWNKMVAVDESVQLIYVFRLPVSQDPDPVGTFQLLSTSSYGNAAYKDVEFISTMQMHAEGSDVQKHREKFPSKLFLTSMEVQGNARAELYVQCSPCKDGGMTDANRPALSQADCQACQPGSYKLANNSGCASCLPCKEGEYKTGSNCIYGTDTFNVACMQCRKLCPAGTYVNGTCEGNAFADETNCPTCGAAGCAPSLLPESSQEQDDLCSQEDCLRRQALMLPLDGWDVERDVSPNRRNLVPMSMSLRSSGPVAVFSSKLSRTGGSSASFNASNHEYYQIPAIGSLFDREIGYRIVSNVSVWEQGMTLAFWIRFESLLGQWQSIIELSNGFGTEHIYVRRHASTNDMVFGVSHSQGSVQRELLANSLIEMGTWKHVAWTVHPIPMSRYYDAIWDLYLDGQAIFTSFSGVMPIDGPYTQNYIGYGTLVDLHSFFQGQMDDLRLYERGLLPLTVYELYSMHLCCGSVVGAYLDNRRSCTTGRDTFDQVHSLFLALFFSRHS